MNSILNRLPIIFGAFAGIFAGIVGIAQNKPAIDIYKTMIVFIAVFIVAGMFLRHILYGILEEQYRKKAKDDKLNKEQDEAQISEPITENNRQTDNQASKIDIVVDDNEEFTPLEFSKAVKTKMNEAVADTKEK